MLLSVVSAESRKQVLSPFGLSVVSEKHNKDFAETIKCSELSDINWNSFTLVEQTSSGKQWFFFKSQTWFDLTSDITGLFVAGKHYAVQCK